MDRTAKTILLVVTSLIAFGLALYAHSNAFSIEPIIAARGFWVLEVVQAYINPEGFALDYPGGARHTTSSNPLNYVHIFMHGLGANPIIVLYVMIALEMATLIGGAFLLWRSLFDEFKPQHPKESFILHFAFIGIICLLLTSSVQRANIAGFGFPFFHGQFYGYADGLRLAMLAMAIRNRWVITAFLFIACFVLHPIKALMISAFITPLFFMNWRQLSKDTLFLASAASALCLCALWYALAIHSTAEPILAQDFVDYTLAQQGHWYPVDIGYLSTIHFAGISPFLAIFLATFIALEQCDFENNQLKVALHWGFAILIVLTLVGLYISVDKQSPTLIRISFIRATTLISLLAPIIIICGAVQSLYKNHWFLAVGFIAFLAPSFHATYKQHYLSPIMAILLVLIHLATSRRLSKPTLAVAIVTFIIMSYVFYSYANFDQIYKYSYPAFTIALGGWLGTLLALKFLQVRPQQLIIPITLCLLGGSLFFVHKYLERNSKKDEENRAYLEVQLWANQNTPPTALFMPDPCRNYGWRDFSGRPSIGVIREWFMTSWIYKGDNQLLEQGKAYASALGFDMEAHRGKVNDRKNICTAARKAYYDPNLRAQKIIAERFQVDYFIFEAPYGPKEIKNSNIPKAFENEHFFVIKALNLK